MDFSLGNWIALKAGPAEIDRWNKLVQQVQALEREHDDLRAFCKGLSRNINAILREPK